MLPEKINRNIILILEGGCMTGAFGAGVVDAFNEAGLNQRVKKVYGVSAGAHNGAYFISEQTKIGSTIYYENLCGNNFIHYNKKIKFLIKIFNKKKYSIVDMDYLQTIEIGEKRIAVEKIKNSEIEFNVLTYNIEKKDWEFINAKEDTILSIKASSVVTPFYVKDVYVAKGRRIDGAIIRNRLLEKCIEKDSLNIVVVNDNHSVLKEIWRTPFMVLYSVLSMPIYGFRFGIKMMFNYFNYPLWQKYENISVIKSDINIKRGCTDKEKVFALYKHGFLKGKEFISKLNL